VQSGDLNRNVRVRVTRAGNSNSVDSAHRTITTAPALTGSVSVTGDAWVGGTLTADTESLGGSGDISFQWQRAANWSSAPWNNISGATEEIYIVQSGDLNRNVRVRVTRAGNSNSVDSAHRTITTAPALTGSVSVTGDAWVGGTLTADTESLGGSGDISFQWQRAANWSSAPWNNISGATEEIYIVQSSDLNQNIRVSVTRANNSGSATSGSIGPIAGTPLLTGTVGITGTPWVGQTLTADTESLGGSGNISFQWQRSSTVGGTSFENISGATNRTYVLQSGDLNRNVRVRVTRVDNSGSVDSTSKTITSAPALTGTVSIIGNPWVGQTLTADTDSLGGSGDISFQWRSSATAGGTWFDITGATDSTFVVRSGDLHRRIHVTVTRANNSGSVSFMIGPIINAPALTGTVSITGNPWVGHTLTADTGSLGGSGDISFQWMRRSSGVGTWTDIGGATASTFVLQSFDFDWQIAVRVTRANNSGSITSNNTIGPITDAPVRYRDFSIDLGIGINQITVPNVSLAAGPGTVTVSNPSQFNQITWFRGATQLSGSGNLNQTLTLDSIVHGNRIGNHRVTVEVVRAGVLHSMVIEFTVVP